MEHNGIHSIGIFLPETEKDHDETNPFEDESGEMDELMDQLFGDDDAMPEMYGFEGTHMQAVLERYKEVFPPEAERLQIDLITWDTIYKMQQFFPALYKTVLLVDESNDRWLQDALWNAMSDNRQLSAIILQWHNPDQSVQTVMREFNDRRERVQHLDLTSQIHELLIQQQCRAALEASLRAD